MSNLTTRKIVLGMLMVLVLAFSVQGIADALTFSTSRSGDLATELPAPNDFDIRFSVSLGSNTTRITNTDGDLVSDDGRTRINSSGYPIVEIAGRVYRTSAAADTIVSGFRRPVSGETDDQPETGDHVVDGSSDSAAAVVDSEGRAIYTTNGGSTRATAAPDAKVSNANRYHYNQEQVTIAVTDVTDAQITHVGRHDIEDTANHVLMETGKDGDQLTGSITLTLQAPAAATVTITISDTTPGSDLPKGESDRAPAIAFTVYVVPGTSAANLALTGAGEDGVQIGNDFGVQQIDGLFQVDPNVPLTYEVEGSGRVFVQVSDDRKTREVSKLETSSLAPVFLKMNRSSNKVTAWVRGTDAKRASQSVTFIHTYADPQITDGDNQRGATGGLLKNPLEVTVRDANNRAISGGVVVGFDSTATDSMFIPVPGTSVYIDTSDDTLVSPATAAAPIPSADTAIATASTPAAIGGPLYVKTDSSGRAEVYFQLGSTAGAQRVTISVNRTPYSDTFFRATATSVTSMDAATITIVDGDNQRADADEPLDDPLVVLVRDAGGRIVSDAPVTFTTSTGTLAPPENRDPGDEDPDTNPNAGFIVINTDETGQASVRYNVGDLTGARQITASIDVGNGRTRTKTFNVNGTGRAAPRPPSEPSEPATGTNTITITLSETTGEPGDEIDVTISASPNTVVVIDSGDLDGDDFSREFGTTPFDTVISLPDEEDEYTFTAEATGYTSDSATVTVESELGELSITAIGTRVSRRANL